MLTLAARVHISPSKHLTRTLLALSPHPSSTRQYNDKIDVDHSASTQAKHSIFQLFSWKLTHQPHEPTLHCNPRFRSREQRPQFDADPTPSIENWDLWFQQSSSSSQASPLSPELLYAFHLPSPMSKRARESPTPEKSHKRERYDPGKFLTCSFVVVAHPARQCILDEWKLPKRVWSNTNYRPQLLRSRYPHFQFHIISYNILAQRLIEDNRRLYNGCAEADLDWSQRRDRLLSEILNQDADVRVHHQLRRRSKSDDRNAYV